MLVEFYSYKIENSQGNDIRLFCHKASQWMKTKNPNIGFGISATEINNLVEIRTKIEISNISELSSFLEKKIHKENQTIEFNDGDSLVVHAGFNSKNIKNLDQKTITSIDPNLINDNGYVTPLYKKGKDFVFSISGNNVFPGLSYETGKSNFRDLIKVKYKNRQIVTQQHGFFLRNCKITSDLEVENLLIFGMGSRISYGIFSVEVHRV